MCLAYLCDSVERTCLFLHSPAATAENITKNIPTAILFREEGSRPRRFRMGSTTLSLRGISMRMSTASNMVSQAAGKRNVTWGIRGGGWGKAVQKRNKAWKLLRKSVHSHTVHRVFVFLWVCMCVSACTWALILLWHPQVDKIKHNEIENIHFTSLQGSLQSIS